MTDPKFIELLDRAKQDARKREQLAWQCIRELLDKPSPEVFPDNNTLFVGSELYATINTLLGYVPLFVTCSDHLSPKIAYLAKNIMFDPYMPI